MKAIELKKFLDGLTSEELESLDVAVSYHGTTDDGDGYADCSDIERIRFDKDYQGNKFIDLVAEGCYNNDLENSEKPLDKSSFSLYNSLMTIEEAKKLAYFFHEGQFRADGVTPYIEHPKAVAELVAEMGGTDDDICLAWLHDIIEESSDKVGEYLGCEMASSPKFIVGAKKFGWDMSFAMRINRLTDTWDKEEIKRMGKHAYLGKLLTSAPSGDVLVKLCDMVCNMRESNGSRMSQEKRYLKAVNCLKTQEREDLTDAHMSLIGNITMLYFNHSHE